MDGLPLDERAEKVCAAAIYKAERGKHPGLLHWALALAETVPELLVKLTGHSDASLVRQRLRTAIREQGAGPALPRKTVVEEAASEALLNGESAIGAERLAVIIWKHASPYIENTRILTCPTSEDASHDTAESRPRRQNRSSHRPAADLPSLLEAIRGSNVPVEISQESSRSGGGLLAQLTIDLTEAARQGKLGPIVGREREIDLVLETLCRVSQRNPALVGPAGVGKTAIAEGVALRIASGDCPDMLRNVRVCFLQPTAILAGVSNPAEYAERVQQLIREASRPDIVLFIDEFHSLLERGTMMEQDLVTLLKPPLARGDIACMAATTDDEYRRVIESDTALARRFQAIRVQEMTAEQTRVVLEAHRVRLQEQRPVQVPASVLTAILRVTADRMPNRRFPDKAVAVLEQVVAHAVFHRRRSARSRDVIEIVERLTGAPADVPHILQNLEEELRERRLLTEEDVNTLMRQLRVATAGLDIRPERPNAVVMMAGEAASLADALSTTIAEHIAGMQERVVDIDFSTMIHPADITRLIGASPSFVGYGEELPIHALLQYPWSVLLCRNVDLCHPSIALTLAAALRKGAIVDGMGRSIRLCDCVVVMTADDHHVRSSQPIGLRQKDDAPLQSETTLRSVRQDLLDLCSIIVTQVPSRRHEWDVAYLEQNVLPEFARLYRNKGLEVHFENTAKTWLFERLRGLEGTEAVERQLGAILGEVLSPFVPKSGMKRVRVTARDGQLKVEIVNRGHRR